MKKFGYLSAASMMALAVAGPIAVAQAQPSETQARQSGLEEIVVTAQRREERVQEIPLAVSAFSAMELEAAQIKDTKDLVRFTPSLTGGLNTGTGGAVSYYMRGIGSTEQIATFDVPVATYVDEIYLARQSVNNVSLFDVERTEVLRGPQGTLFGRNTTGGAISIITRKPGDEFGGFIEASAGSFERYVLRGSVDLPIADQVLTKVSAFVVDDAGYATSATTGEDLNGEEAQGVRLATRLLPSDKLTWDLSVDYIDQDKTTIGVWPQDLREYRPRTGLRTGDCSDGIIQEYVTQLVGNCSNIATGGVTSNLAYDFDFATVNVITGYRATDQSFSLDFGAVAPGSQATGAFMIANEIVNTQFTQEIKLTGETGAVKWVAGAFYLDEQNKNEQLQVFGLFGGLVDGHWVMKNDAQSFAVYAQGDFALSDATTLTVGGRWTTEDKSIGYDDATRAASGYPRLGLVSTGSPTIPVTPGKIRPTTANLRALGVPLSQSTEKFTPRIAVSHKLDEDKLIYVSATNGFKSGGWEARQVDARLIRTFAPETAWTYEAGLRSEWLDRTLRVNATVYRQKIEDIQLISGFPLGAGISFVTQNNGTLEGTGFELEVLARPNDQFDVFATFSAADREYVDVPLRNGAGGVPCTAVPEPGNCITTEDEPVRYPELQGTLGGRYSVPLPQIGSTLSFTASGSFSGHYWTSTSNDTPFAIGTPFLGPPATFGPTTNIARLSKVKPTQIFNIGMNLKTDDGRWEAALECSNCTEEYYFTSSLAGVGYENDPRRVTGRLKFNF
jgi:iron complex outermembrane receptor protein